MYYYSDACVFSVWLTQLDITAEEKYVVIQSIDTGGIYLRFCQQ